MKHIFCILHNVQLLLQEMLEFSRSGLYSDEVSEEWTPWWSLVASSGGRGSCAQFLNVPAYGEDYIFISERWIRVVAGGGDVRPWGAVRKFSVVSLVAVAGSGGVVS